VSLRRRPDSAFGFVRPTGRALGWLGAGAIAAGLLFAPAVLNQYLLSILVLILFYGYLSTGWNILGGYAGQLSVGHALFFGIGAYTSTLLGVQAGLSPWLGLVAGGLLAVAVSQGIGYLTFRYGIRGHYFALVTIAVAEIARHVTLNIPALGGAMGLVIPLRRDAPLEFQFADKRGYYYVILAFVAVVLFVTLRLQQAKLGLYLVAVREDEVAAECMGVPTMRAKMTAMALSAFLTAAGGTFYAQYFLYIDPDLTFGVFTSIDILIRAVAGGAGTVWGPLVGSLLMTPLAEAARVFLGGRKAGIHVMLYGLILMGVVLLVPQGVYGYAVERVRARRERGQARDLARG
jgi:branched-chain amino acid transport system permease protein